MKRSMSKFIAALVAVTLFAFTTGSVYAIDTTDTTALEMNDKTVSTVADDGWTSGSFSISMTTGLKYFKQGTIYVVLNSSNSSATGRYTVQLFNSLGGLEDTLTAPCNGIITLNFPNKAAGYYRLSFTASNEGYLQKYEIIRAGTAGTV